MAVPSLKLAMYTPSRLKTCKRASARHAAWHGLELLNLCNEVLWSPVKVSQKPKPDLPALSNSQSPLVPLTLLGSDSANL